MFLRRGSHSGIGLFDVLEDNENAQGMLVKGSVRTKIGFVGIHLLWKSVSTTIVRVVPLESSRLPVVLVLLVLVAISHRVEF